MSKQAHEMTDVELVAAARQLLNNYGDDDVYEPTMTELEVVTVLSARVYAAATEDQQEELVVYTMFHLAGGSDNQIELVQLNEDLTADQPAKEEGDDTD